MSYIAHDGEMILGIGKTKSEARKDAAGFMDPGADTSALRVNACTPAMYKHIDENGAHINHISWDVDPTTDEAFLRSERE